MAVTAEEEKDRTELNLLKAGKEEKKGSSIH